MPARAESAPIHLGGHFKVGVGCIVPSVPNKRLTDTPSLDRWIGTSLRAKHNPRVRAVRAFAKRYELRTNPAYATLILARCAPNAIRMSKKVVKQVEWLTKSWRGVGR